MVGWDTPFEESMLSRGNVIIYCPDENLVGELFDIFKAHGISWYSGESMMITFWHDQGYDTCYRVTSRGELKRGNTECYADYIYDDHVKCQFYGVESDNEISDSDFETIISAGGGR